jgi:carbonic anhydrase
MDKKVIRLNYNKKIVVFPRELVKGPEHWDSTYDTCKGKHQSPIDIDVMNVKKVQLPPLMFENFDMQPLSTNVLNNGHTGKCSIVFINN